MRWTYTIEQIRNICGLTRDKMYHATKSGQVDMSNIESVADFMQYHKLRQRMTAEKK